MSEANGHKPVVTFATKSHGQRVSDSWVMALILSQAQQETSSDISVALAFAIVSALSPIAEQSTSSPKVTCHWRNDYSHFRYRCRNPMVMCPFLTSRVTDRMLRIMWVQGM